MAHSSQITNLILTSVDPLAERDRIWKKTRYLVAQKVKTEEFSGTDQDHYRGHHVLPGPAADPSICGMIEGIENVDLMESKHGITFVDFKTTEGADTDVVSAPYTVMSDPEADDFENVNRKAAEKRKTAA